MSKSTRRYNTRHEEELVSRHELNRRKIEDRKRLDEDDPTLFGFEDESD